MRFLGRIMESTIPSFTHLSLDHHGQLFVRPHRGQTVTVWSEQQINAGQTLTSEAIDLDGLSLCAVYVSCNQSVSRTFEVSDNGQDWYQLTSGGVMNTIASNISANTPVATVMNVAGMRYLRVKVQNTGGSAGSLTVKVGLGSY